MNHAYFKQIEALLFPLDLSSCYIGGAGIAVHGGNRCLCTLPLDICTSSTMLLGSVACPMLFRGQDIVYNHTEAEMAMLKEQVPEMGTIEVLQALHIEVPRNELSAVRQKLIDTAQTPWMHDEKGQSGDPNFTVFRHNGDDAHSSVRLRLRQNNSGFDVSSINPQGFEDISVLRYNDLLQDFAENVVTPAIKYNGSAMTLSNKRQSPADWFKPEAAYALYKFCISKDKRVDYFDSEDKDRWMNFLIKAHDSDLADTVFDNLERWLRHSEGLSDELSLGLSSELRFSIDLIKHYNKTFCERSAS